MFEPVDAEVDFVALEERILDLWQREGTFAERVRLNAGKPRWSFLDGPITANNPMGVHHAWGRTYKDLFLRFRAMLGHELRYQNGFDCQGLWVEVEVEKELGFTSKKDIERYGVDRFIERCKERVLKYAAVQTEQSKRLGYWTDWDNSYFTMSEENNYCIWLFLKRCHEQGWLYKGRDAMPWCPRCGTGISDMEIATEGYKELTHDSVYVRFGFADDPADGLLVWTTTPWTLAANVAAAVHPDREYVNLDLGGGRRAWLLGALAAAVAPGRSVVARAPGHDLVGRRYTTACDDLPAQVGIEHRVIPWDEVTEEEGTGIVHIAPGAGSEDFALGREHGLALLIPIDEAGEYVEGYGPLTGKAAGSVTPEIVARFRAADGLFQVVPYTHRYPVCWRCGSELLFRVVDEWFIRMDELRPRIMDVTRRIRWIPEYGMQHELDWLLNMHDWMISKKRYWGLALPIFECACGWFDVIGSEAELKERAVAGIAALEGHTPHKPWIDEVKVRCGRCGEAASRIKDVGNPWLDAGIVPFSTLGYRGDRAHWEKWFPADFITESLPGQFRNWFYALLCMATALEDREPFRAVLGHGLVKDEKGEEMHKSKGNSIPFDQAARELGVDPMRWLFARHNPSANLNFGPTPVGECRRRLLTYWNVYSFFVTYARLDGFDPAAPRPDAASRSDLDRWILSRLAGFVGLARDRLSNYDPAAVVRAAEGFLEDLSNHYLRRSRRRFWKSEGDADKRAAYATLYESLETFTRVMAPIVPFVTDAVWQNLGRGRFAGAPSSVHLCDYPAADAALVDPRLESDVSAAENAIELGHAARQDAQVKVRQPLGRMVVRAAAADAAGVRRFAAMIKDELNVHAIEWAEGGAALVEHSVKPDFRALGARFGARTKLVAEALKALDGAEVKRRLDAGEPVTVEVGGESIVVAGGELKVESKARSGLAVKEARGMAVALDLTITPELRREGLARDLVRHIQDLRKEARLEVQDRIRLALDAPGEIGQVVAEWGAYVARETLALELTSPFSPIGPSAELKLGGETLKVALARVGGEPI